MTNKMTECVRRINVQDEIDRWLNSVGTIMVGKGLSSYGELIGCVEDTPAADVAPVVHGRWEFLGPNGLIKECMCGTCSVCKVRSKYIIRADVDRRLQAKVPEREFVPWFGRYPMQQQTTLEEEHAACGKKWRKR